MSEESGSAPTAREVGGTLLSRLRYGGEPHGGTKRERTLAVTIGPWGGVWFTGKRGLLWRLCLGFVAVTYVPAEMTQILDVWLTAETRYLLTDAVRAIYALMDEAAGPKKLDEMHPDALIPHSNGYGTWFVSPENAKFGTAPLHREEVAERLERWLRDA